MKTKKFTLVNEFHNTTITLRAKTTKNNGIYFISANQVKKAKKTLCGIPGCLCSGELGTQGKNNPQYETFSNGSAILY